MIKKNLNAFASINKMTKQTTTEQLKKKYNKICEKIEQLNEDAFNIEKELMYRHNEENN